MLQDPKTKQEEIVTNFGHDLLLSINSEQSEGTIFISPLSVNTALLMTACGSSGKTLTDFVDVLHLGNLNSSDSILKFQENLADVRKSENAIPLYRVANSVWISDKFQIYKNFVDSIKKSFGSKVEVANFSASKTTTDINSWISAETQGLIKKIIDVIKSDEIMFLINTVYFKQNWAQQFKVASSKEGNFTLLNGSIKRSMFMHRSEKNLYFSDGEVEAVLLRFEQKQMSLLVILPKGRTNDVLVQAASKYLSYVGITNITKNSKSTKLNLALPRFKLSFSISLKNVLRKLGLESAFSSSANFSCISKDPVKISDVIHQAVLRVDENGVEAAAVTVVRMNRLMGMVDIDMPIPFVVNRPFVCALLNAGMVVFSGIIREVEGTLVSSAKPSSSPSSSSSSSSSE